MFNVCCKAHIQLIVHKFPLVSPSLDIHFILFVFNFYFLLA